MNLTPNRVRGFWAAFVNAALAVWTLSSALVLDPALPRTPSRSGIAATPQPSATTAAFFRRLPLRLGIRLPGVARRRLTRPHHDLHDPLLSCHFLGAVATGVWPLAAFRFIVNVGIGGEWMSAASVAEWPRTSQEGRPDAPLLLGHVRRARELLIGSALMARGLAVGGCPPSRRLHPLRRP